MLEECGRAFLVVILYSKMQRIHQHLLALPRNLNGFDIRAGVQLLRKVQSSAFISPHIAGRIVIDESSTRFKNVAFRDVSESELHGYKGSRAVIRQEDYQKFLTASRLSAFARPAK